MTASGSTRTKADDERDPEAAPSWRERPETPKPKPRTAGEIAFLDLGPGAHKWLVEAANSRSATDPEQDGRRG